MAIDEVLLGQAEGPLLRIYRWAEPSVSFGYFEKHIQIQSLYPKREQVRRWTGGGIVEHGHDFTYSLVVPAPDPFLQHGTLASYEQIHLHVLEALRRCGFEPEVAPEQAPKISQACFENPARHDVLIGGRKVAGAAQRRSRRGLLHQGSIQIEGLGEEFPGLLAAQLGASVLEYQLGAAAFEAAVQLAKQKYGSPEWLHKF